MYKKLHLQLTFFCCLIITLILTVMSFFCIRLARKNEIAAQFSNFQQNMNYILQEISEQNCISHAWLDRITGKYGLSLSLLDNGVPLLYQTGGQKEQEYFAQARDMAQQDHSFSQDLVRGHSYASHLEFQDRTITGESTFFSVAFLPRETGFLTVTSMCLVPPGSDFSRNVVRPVLLFTAAAVLILSAASHCLIGRLIKPLANNHRQQVEFFASASHELRSPLSVIAASLSAAENAPEEKKSALLSVARRECSRMRRLINDMFTLACLDHGALSIHREETGLENLVIESYEKFLPVFSGKNIHVQFQLPETLLSPCYCDQERIRQLFSILMDNAAAYTPENGEIRISLKFEGNLFLFTVSDNGPGIPDSEKDKIFRRFYRCDQSRSDKNHFGLGLGIAREIVTLHQGDIQVTDTPGGGATFRVLLPAGKKADQYFISFKISQKSKVAK